MQLTSAQRQLLVAYRDFHRDGISLPGLYRRSWRGAVLLAVYFAAAAAFCFAYALPWQGALLAGMAIGLFLRDSASVRRTLSVWPVVSEITDWAKVDQLLAAHEKPQGGVHA